MTQPEEVFKDKEKVRIAIKIVPVFINLCPFFFSPFLLFSAAVLLHERRKQELPQLPTAAAAAAAAAVVEQDQLAGNSDTTLGQTKKDWRLFGYRRQPGYFKSKLNLAYKCAKNALFLYFRASFFYPWRI